MNILNHAKQAVGRVWTEEDVAYVDAGLREINRVTQECFDAQELKRQEARVNGQLANGARFIRRRKA